MGSKNKSGGGGPAFGQGKRGGGGSKNKFGNAQMLGVLLFAAAGGYILFAMLQKDALEGIDAERSRRMQESTAMPSGNNKRQHPKKPPTKKKKADRASKYAAPEWQSLSRSMDACLASQEELMTVPVAWPGFHALCIDAVSADEIKVLLHARSGATGSVNDTPRPLLAKADDAPATAQPGDALDGPLVSSLVGSLQDELLEHEYQQVDPMVSTSAYDFTPNPWRLFTSRGGLIDADADLLNLGRGASVWLYTGGQFIWPGVRIGHTFSVPIPLANGEHKEVMLTTKSLRPTVFTLHGFLSEEECDFIKSYASTRMVPSGLAMMDSSGDSRDVRTSTQTFMERNGSPQIRALEERAHNLTRLPYDLGENIQVVRYEKGQKYGAHRDFFNPNDYHKQPGMLRNVEYGARNRLATVFWYLQSVDEGGETFFPRALNEQGKEYHPWNGNHDDCYRGLFVPPVRGNAVLFYSMVPDGRLDERSLHGGCRPQREGVEKWGANQWIWNHAQRKTHSSVAPRRATGGRKGAPRTPRRGGADCEDADENCAVWADGGECEKNPEFMLSSCRASCGACK